MIVERKESKKENRCKICGNTRNLHRYDGEYWCKNHLNQKLALGG